MDKKIIERGRRAIQARLTGNYDDKDLKHFGARGTIPEDIDLIYRRVFCELTRKG